MVVFFTLENADSGSPSEGFSWRAFSEMWQLGGQPQEGGIRAYGVKRICPRHCHTASTLPTPYSTDSLDDTLIYCTTHVSSHTCPGARNGNSLAEHFTAHELKRFHDLIVVTWGPAVQCDVQSISKTLERINIWGLIISHSCTKRKDLWGGFGLSCTAVVVRRLLFLCSLSQI